LPKVENPLELNTTGALQRTLEKARAIDDVTVARSAGNAPFAAEKGCFALAIRPPCL
jgi:hypothetical protein